MHSELQERIHHLPAAPGHYVLAQEIAELRASPRYRKDGRAAQTLLDRREMSIVLVALAEGKTLNEHRIDWPLSIHTVEGWLAVHARDCSIEEVAGGLQLLDPCSIDDVQALSDSALLLTVPWPELVTT